MDGIIAESFTPKRRATAFYPGCKQSKGSERWTRAVESAVEIRARVRQWCAANVKNCSLWRLVRESRKRETEVLEEGTNWNVTNGPVRPALSDSIFSVVESGDRNA